jgi:hypothetical protein
VKRAQNFDERWRQLSAQARGVESAAAQLPDLASLARTRAPEALPLASPRVVRALALAAATWTCLLAPRVLRALSADSAREFAGSTRLSAPPQLPSPPALESPAFYVARAERALRELTP